MSFALRCSFLPEKKIHEMFLKKKWYKNSLFWQKAVSKGKMQESSPYLKFNFTACITSHWDLYYSLAMSWFDCGLTFTHFYLVISNLLPNFFFTATHLVFNIMTMFSCSQRCLQFHRIYWWPCIYQELKQTIISWI